MSLKLKQENGVNDAIPPILYNIPTWCTVMGFGRSKTYEMLGNGQLKAVKIAGRTLIPASEATRLIEEAVVMGHHDKRPLPGTGSGLQNQSVHLTSEQTDNNAHRPTSQEHHPFVRDHILKARALGLLGGGDE